jgi:hypothetical protein
MQKNRNVKYNNKFFDKFKMDLFKGKGGIFTSFDKIIN